MIYLKSFLAGVAALIIAALVICVAFFGTVKVHVTAPPEKGKANEQVCSVLAAYYRVPVRSVQIASGHGNPRKLVRIDLT